MTMHLRNHPPVVPDTDRPPTSALGSFPHHAVRLIPMADAESRLSEQQTELSPTSGLHSAHERLDTARDELARAKAGVSCAMAASDQAVEAAGRARDTYEQARADARRAELILRQQQRRIEDAKLALRQAYEAVARLEGLTIVADEPPATSDSELGAA
jgi:hypothetical protein